MDVDKLLFGCELSIAPDSFVVHAPDLEIARSLKQAIQRMALQALKLGKRETLISYPGCDRPYQIPAKMAMQQEESMGGVEPPKLELFGADYLKILEHLLQLTQEGKIVQIVDNDSDRCLHVNNLLRPSRAYWDSQQFIGFNYAVAWRKDGRDQNSEPSDQYYRLKDVLRQDKRATGYSYQLYRPDGAYCEYSTDYFLCHDYCGHAVRIGVSRVEDWRLLQPVQV